MTASPALGDVDDVGDVGDVGDVADGVEAATTMRRASASRRSPVLVVIAILGIALVAAPAIFQMFTRAPKGATMLADFKPFMTEQRLDGFHNDIAEIDAAVRALDAARPAAATSNATYQQFASQWPTIHTDMSDLLDKVSGNRDNYRAVAALPSFRLFPWFFVIPGVLIAAVALAAVRWPRVRRGARIALVALGIGLVLAPAVFSMFTRAPKGGDMMTAFKDLETTQKVQTIQGYFATMAVGQGAIRLDIDPALRRAGTQIPAVTALNRDWVHILNDMTPMIGAMSDNVDNYQAIAALPPFPLFPYFFVLPGVIVAGLALRIRPEPGRSHGRAQGRSHRRSHRRSQGAT